MKRLPEEITQFFLNLGFAIVSTIDKKGFPHNACKGIVKINSKGEVYLMDLYKAATYDNLKNNSLMSIAIIDEHKFIGYCLKGKAKIVPVEKLSAEIVKAWEDKITSRLTRRLLKNIHEEKGHPLHPEVLLPKPEYMIVMDVEDIIDLTPHHLK